MSHQLSLRTISLIHEEEQIAINGEYYECVFTSCDNNHSQVISDVDDVLEALRKLQVWFGVRITHLDEKKLTLYVRSLKDLIPPYCKEDLLLDTNERDKQIKSFYARMLSN